MLLVSALGAWGEIFDTCTMYIQTNSRDVAHVVPCLSHACWQKRRMLDEVYRRV